MATVFCTNCGGKHEYAGFAPNFCSKCGNPMSGKPAKAQAPQKISKQSVDEDEEDSEDSSDIDELPDIDKLDVEIEIDGGFRSFSLEDLSRNPQMAQARKFSSKRLGGIDSLSPTKYGSTKASQD